MNIFNKFAKSALVGGAILVPVLVFGQDSLRDRRMELQQDIQQQRDDLRGEIQEKREGMRQEMQDKRGAMTDELKAKREAMMQEMKAKREALRDEIIKKREAFREEAQKRREELRKKLGEKRAENIERFFNNMVRKFENAIERLEKLADRIDARLKKAKERGKDVASLEDLLQAARGKIDAVKTALEDAKAKYTAATGDPDFGRSFKKVKELVRGVAQKAKDAHKALVEVIRSTKGLGVDAATSTPPTP